MTTFFGGALIKKSVLIILFLTLAITSACAPVKNTPAKTKSLENIYQDAEIEKVDKVIIQDGSTGVSKTITEQQQVNDFLSLIKDIEFTPQDNQEKRVGWRYSIALFDNETEFKFTTNQIGDTYYDSNPDILPVVDSYYQQLKIDDDNK